MSALSKVKLFSRDILNFRRKINALKSRTYCAENVGTIVPAYEVSSFIERCMTAVGTQPTHAKALADNLTAADHRGHFSHGLNRLGRVFLLLIIGKHYTRLYT